MHTTPVSLLERVRRPGEQQAWALFVDMYTPLLFEWARRMGLQEPDAADLVQEVFAVLVVKLPAFLYDRRKGFRAWLRTVLNNKWRDTCRRRAVRPQLRGAEQLTDLAAEPDQEAFWEVEYRNHLVGRALEVMQQEFQPTTWRACWETVVSGRSAGEVAAALGMSLDAVYTARSRVLRRLRKELEGLLD
jgi:RNA polymerase sigma-70 factor (ECF subfamily)